MAATNEGNKIERFLTGWGRYLFNSFSFTFTVGGVIVALILARENWWISILVVIAAFVASGAFAYAKYNEKERANQTHARQLQAIQEKFEEAESLRTDAERKLNEIPFDSLMKLQNLIVAHSYAELSRMLVRHTNFIARMKRFDEATARQINLRTFIYHSGRMYALARVKAPALDEIREGDRFLLVRKTADGLETPSAYLVVHQAPNRSKEMVYFEIAEFLSDEMGVIERLAEKQDIAGIKGYIIKLAVDVDAYKGIDINTVADTIHKLIHDMGKIDGAQHD